MSFTNLKIDAGFMRDLEESLLYDSSGSPLSDTALEKLKKTSAKQILKNDIISHINRTEKSNLADTTTKLDSFISKYETYFKQSLCYKQLELHFNSLVNEAEGFAIKAEKYRMMYRDSKALWGAFEVDGFNYPQTKRLKIG